MIVKNVARSMIAALLLSVLFENAYTATPLVDAVRTGNKAAVLALLNKATDVNAPETDGSTALHWAAYDDNSELIDTLIHAGANATAVNRYGITPLYSACVNGNATIVRMLLNAGADPNTALPEGETALMTAARTGKEDAVKVLLDAGADPNAKEAWRGQTALMWAAAEGHADVIRALITSGANIEARSKADYVPSEAQFRQNEDQYGQFTALLFAAREGKISAVEILVKAGADINETLVVTGPKGPKPGRGPNAFLLAVGSAQYELAAWLLDHGVDPNTAPQGWTALHQIAWVRKPGDVGHSAPPPEGSGNMSSFDFVRTLIKHGANVNAQATAKRAPAGGVGLNMAGATPFLMAARTKDADYMRLLAELGADPLMPNEDKTTPLMVAAGIGMSAAEDGETEADLMEAVDVALKMGNDINAVDNNDETVMHGAAYKLLPSLVRFLAENGANIEVWNRPNKKGSTPLDIIIRNKTNIGSQETETAIRQLMNRAGIPAVESQEQGPR